MAYPRIRFLFPLIVVAGAGSLLGQAPFREPFQSREPPLADPVEAVRTAGGYDPDEPGAIERTQYVVPSPRSLPGNVVDGNSVVPAQYTSVVAPAGELPTPVVTLNIVGSDVSPSGQAVIFKLRVRNVSRAKAHNVTVRVKQPKNAERIKWDPVATEDAVEARWEFKTLDAGQERTIEISYKPKAETDDVRIEARVQFDFGRGMITKVAPPSLNIKKEGPEKMVVGDVATYRITITNDGRVTIRDIEVKELLNKGLVYEDRELARGMVDGRLMSRIDPQSGERQWTVPALAPGQKKVIEYRVKARDQGKIGSVVLATAADIKKQANFDTEVLTANMQITADGPVGEKGTVGQTASYRATIENKGTATLRNVVVKCVYPPDMRPTKATNGGQPFREQVQWVFRELKSGESKELNIGLATSTPGQRTVQFVVRADKGKEQKASVKTTFAGVPALSWDTDVPGTVSAGKNMTYRVIIANTGTAVAEGIQVRVDLPEKVDLISTTPQSGRGLGQNANMVIFPAYDIPPGKKTTLRIEVKARAAGEARVGFQLIDPRSASKVPVEEKKTTVITGSDTRSPSGPPPARPGKIDPSTIGSR